MKFAVVTFPGSNCDDDMAYALETTTGAPVERLWHKDAALPSDVECVVLPGGFSYGDYLRCGAVARFSPIMRAVIEFANNGGYVVGICNGFQILCESGLLPGVLLRNDRQKFICKNIFLKTQTKKTALTQQLDAEKIFKIPIAHAEGRYHADAATMQELIDHDQIIFKYCDENGSITEAANPNGTALNIAGVCNRRRNVFGMMPHPERAADSALGNTDGLLLLQSLAQSKN